MVSPKNGATCATGGKPGNRGGGRPPKALKEFLEQLRRNPNALDALERAACNPNSRGFRVAWQLASQYDPERPSDKHHVDVGDRLEDILGRMHRERREHEAK